MATNTSLLTDEVKEVNKVGGRTINRRVNGIKSMFDEEGDDTHCFVDKSIAGIIAKLAEGGNTPWTSCSGLRADHPDCKTPHYRAYLGCKVLGRKVELAAKTAGFRVEPSHHGGVLLYAWPEKNFIPVVPRGAEKILSHMWSVFAAQIGAQFPT